MAKKQKNTKVSLQADPGDEHIETMVVEQPKVETPVMEKPLPKKKQTWEIKDRVYMLKGRKKPLTFMMKSHTIYWFDEEKGYERELKYCKNQRTCFVDEMVGDHRLEHIVFKNGMLLVQKNEVTLQKLLSLYHPSKDLLYYEFKAQEKAVDEIQILEAELEAMNLAKNLDIDLAEAIMRTEVGSDVSKMSSKEIKRDLLIFAKTNPNLFIELASDENVHLRNMGIRATEAGIITLSTDQRVFSWTSNNRKLMNVPFDEHPYSALAAWFKTDEGMEVFSSVEKQLK